MSKIRIPEGWQCVKLGNREFFKDIIGGGTPSRERSDYFGGGIPWIRLSDMKSKYVDQTKETLTKDGLMNSSAKIVPKNTVILSTRATIGEVAIANTNVCTNQGFKSIICNEERVLPEFVYYFLKSIKHILQSKSKSTTYSEINKTNLEDIDIVIPSIEIQEKIVQKLDYVLGQLEEKEKLILELYKKRREIISPKNSPKYEINFRDSIFAKAFISGLLSTEFNKITFSPISEKIEFKTIIELTKNRGGGTPSKVNSEFWNGHIPWVSPKDMKSYEIFDSQDHITENAIKQSTTNLIPKDSLLIVFRSGILSHSIPIAINRVPVTINQDLKAFIPKSDIDVEFLAFFLRSMESKIIRECVKHVTTAHSMKPEEFYKIKIPVLPKTAQQKLVHILTGKLVQGDKVLEKIDQILEFERKSLKHIDHLKKSISDMAFQGKLVN